MAELLIYGAGGFGREVLQLATDIAHAGRALECLGFLSDNPEEWGTTVSGLPVLGDASYLMAAPGRYSVALGIGAPAAKRRIAARIASLVRDFPPLIHPNVVSSLHVRAGQGLLICAGSVLTVDIVIGEFVTINLACTVGHDAVLGNYVTLAPGVNVSGAVQIETGCDMGTGSTVIQGRTIGEWSIIGAGAVVSGDLPANCTAVGIPARAIKTRPAGWHDGAQ